MQLFKRNIKASYFLLLLAQQQNVNLEAVTNFQFTDVVSKACLHAKADVVKVIALDTQ